MDIKQIIREELKAVLKESFVSATGDTPEDVAVVVSQWMADENIDSNDEQTIAEKIAGIAFDSGVLDDDIPDWQDAVFEILGGAVNEEKKADKDYDGDGKIESSEDEWKGSRDKAIKKAVTETIEGILSEEEGEKGMSMDDAMASVYTQYSRAKFLQLLDDIDKRVMDLRSGNPMKYSGTKTPFYAIRGAIQDIKNAAKTEIKNEDE